MKDISNYIRLTIPNSVRDNTEVMAAIEKATRYANGVTATDARGGWYDDDGFLVKENVTLFQWNFGNNSIETMRALSAEVVDAVFAAGEAEVFRERYFQVGGVFTGTLGYIAGILYAPKVGAL